MKKNETGEEAFGSKRNTPSLPEEMSSEPNGEVQYI